MRTRAIPLVLVLAVACGSADGSPAGGDYYAELARISQNAHIQVRGLARDFRVRTERAATVAERLDAIEVTVDQRVRLYEDVVDALENLHPAEGIGAAHDAFTEAWEALLDLTRKVRDSGIRTIPEYLETLEAEAFEDAAADVERTCADLETIAAAADRPVDLACGRRVG